MKLDFEPTELVKELRDIMEEIASNDFALLECDDLIEIHNSILPSTPAHIEKVEGIAGRIENRAHYEGVNSAFELAALHAECVARGHGFADGNKRTAYISCITVLTGNGLHISEGFQGEILKEGYESLEEQIVQLAEGKMQYKEFANHLAITYSAFVLGVGISQLVGLLFKK